jgi:hypothetical protein
MHASVGVQFCTKLGAQSAVREGRALGVVEGAVGLLEGVEASLRGVEGVGLVRMLWAAEGERKGF